MSALSNEPGLKVLERVLAGVAYEDARHWLLSPTGSSQCRLVYVQVRIPSHASRSGRCRGVMVRGESVLDLLIVLRDELERVGIQIDRIECFDAGWYLNLWRWVASRRRRPRPA